MLDLDPFRFYRIQLPYLLYRGVDIVVYGLAAIDTLGRNPASVPGGGSSQQQPALGSVAIRAGSYDMHAPCPARKPAHYHGETSFLILFLLIGSPNDMPRSTP